MRMKDEEIHNESGSDDKETYNEQSDHIDEASCCNESESDDKSEGGEGADAATTEITATWGMVYCCMAELRILFNEYCIFAEKKYGEEEINMRDAMVLLETRQGNVYMVGDMIFVINPEVVGELMAKLVDHSLKERVLNNDSEMMEALEGFEQRRTVNNSRTILLYWLKKFVQTGEIQSPKVLRFLWRDVLLPSRTSADDYDSLVDMFVDSGVICMASSSALEEMPVLVVSCLSFPKKQVPVI